MLQALHFDTPSNFSRSELWTDLPSSGQDFQRIYQAFLQQEDEDTAKLQTISLNSGTQEDAILLLIAVLSDSICLRRSLGPMVLTAHSVVADQYKHNPYLPLSPHTEFGRMQRLLSGALDRWQREFQLIVSTEVMALYHYCRLYLSCPKISYLSQLASYKPSIATASLPESTTGGNTIGVSDESISYSWLVLDSSAARSKQSDSLCPAWLPIVVFHASLVVWAKLSISEGSRNGTYGSTKILLAFKAELEKLEWPCCVEMMATLDRLMSKPMRDSTR